MHGARADADISVASGMSMWLCMSSSPGHLTRELGRPWWCSPPRNPRRAAVGVDAKGVDVGLSRERGRTPDVSARGAAQIRWPRRETRARRRERGRSCPHRTKLGSFLAAVTPLLDATRMVPYTQGRYT